MDHFRLSDELRQKLIESAAWGKAGFETHVIEEGSTKKKGYDVGKEKELGHPDAAEDKKLIKKMMKKEEKKEHKKGKGDKDCSVEDSTQVEDGEDAEELAEEVHVCPLCTSQLEEALEEERLLEHLDVIMGLVERLSQLNEGEEDVEAVIDETLKELLLQDDTETLDEDEEVVEEE
jgi:hypothetical protein